MVRSPPWQKGRATVSKGEGASPVPTHATPGPRDPTGPAAGKDIPDSRSAMNHALASFLKRRPTPVKPILFRCSFRIHSLQPIVKPPCP